MVFEAEDKPKNPKNSTLCFHMDSTLTWFHGIRIKNKLSSRLTQKTIPHLISNALYCHNSTAFQSCERLYMHHVCVYNYMYTYQPKEHLFFFLIVRRVYHGFNMFRWSLVQSRGTFEKSTLLRKVMLRDPLVPNTLSRMSSHFFAAV